MKHSRCVFSFVLALGFAVVLLAPSGCEDGRVSRECLQDQDCDLSRGCCRAGRCVTGTDCLVEVQCGNGVHCQQGKK